MEREDVMDKKNDFYVQNVSQDACHGTISSSFASTSVVNEKFQRFVERVHSCHRCPRMEGRTRVFGLENGSINARILFIAEAPGRFGAERTGIPLAGDQTGRNFEMLLNEADLQRASVFITNAVLCNPQDIQGRNASPSPSEIANCSDHLRTTLDLLQPQYVIALGHVALRALQHVEMHSLTLIKDTGRPVIWYNRWLIALYHPGPRARVHRSFERQKEDFRQLKAFIMHAQIL